jgi:glucosyl-dolichyl phosphate glucuronosyltransferase
MTTKPAISVIICSYNREEYIVGAIESLYSQTLEKSKYEIIIVDNNSSDNTEEVVQHYISTTPGIRAYYLSEKQQGASFARNTGAAFAKAELLCFMDDDAIAEEHYLERIVSFFSDHADAVGLGGRIIPKYIPGEPNWMSYYVSSLVGNFDYSPGVRVFEKGKYPLESNMVVRKTGFDSIGGFNNQLPGVVGTLRIGGEGKDFYLRLQQRGGKIYYDPSIIVHHIVEVKKLTPEYMYRVASGIGRGERIRMLQQGRKAYWLKFIEYIYKLGGAIVLAVLYSLKGKPSQGWPVIKFRIDAIKGLIGR